MLSFDRAGDFVDEEPAFAGAVCIELHSTGDLVIALDRVSVAVVVLGGIESATGFSSGDGGNGEVDTVGRLRRVKRGKSRIGGRRYSRGRCGIICNHSDTRDVSHREHSQA